MNFLVAFAAFTLFTLSAMIKWKIPATILSVFFLAVAVVFASKTWLVIWIRDNFVAPVFGWVGGWIGASPSLIAGTIVLCTAATVVIVLLVTKSMTKEVVGALVVCGLLVTLASGPVAQAVTAASNGVERAGMSTVARWIGA